jgi:hypothetical protein
MIVKEIHLIVLILLKNRFRNYASIVSPSNEILDYLGIVRKALIWPWLGDFIRNLYIIEGLGFLQISDKLPFWLTIRIISRGKFNLQYADTLYSPYLNNASVSFVEKVFGKCCLKRLGVAPRQ